MDAFELLRKDHRKVSELFSQIESASGQAKKQLFSQLKSELDLHAHIEEAIFYPALENTKEAREITLEAYEEHKVVKDLLAELANGSAPDDEWDAKLTVLKENVEHHVEEEEGELFDKSKDALSDEQIEKIGADMEREKARNQGGDANAQRAANPSRATKTSKSKRSSGKASKESGGVLKRLAEFVGLSDSSAQPSKGSNKGSKKSASKSSKKAAPAKSGSSKAGKGKSSKSATKTSRKGTGGTKASQGATKGTSKGKSSGGRSAKKSTKRGGAVKSSKGRSSKKGGGRR